MHVQGVRVKMEPYNYLANQILIDDQIPYEWSAVMLNKNGLLWLQRNILKQTIK